MMKQKSYVCFKCIPIHRAKISICWGNRMNWFESLLWATYHFQGSALKLESGSFSTYLKVLNLFQKKLFWMKVFTFSINFGKDCNIPFQVLVNFTQVAHTSRWGQNKWCYSYWKFAVILIALFYLKVLL